MKVLVLDDYLGVARQSADWDSLPAGTVVLGDPAMGEDGRVRLAWRANPGTPRFLVDVRSSDGIPRFAGSSEGLALDLPADVSAEVMKGADLVWSVTALDADGNATGKSASAPLSAPAAPGIP